MTVLVIGGTGFIGARLVRELGDRAVVTSRGARQDGRLARWPGRWETVDPGDPVALTATLARVGPEVVVHAAVGRGPDSAADIGGERRLAEAVCAAADGAGVPHLVTLGSGTEYGAHEPPFHEGLAPRPTTGHGRAKAAGTAAVRAWAATSATTTTVLRPFHVSGPGEPPDKLLPRALSAAHGGPPLPLVDGAPVRDVVGVDDIVRAILAAIEHPPGDGVPVNLCSGRAVAVRDVVTMVESVLGRPVPTRGTHPRTALDGERRIGDPSRAAALWGWQASPLSEVVAVAAAAWPWGADG